MKYVVFDAAGVLLERLIQGVHEIPATAVEVDESLWMRVTQEVDGIWMLAGDRSIYKAPRPELEVPEYTNEQIEARRLRAYADPLTGSDRFFAEAQRMEAMGKPGWEAVREAGVRRFNEIQGEFPWAAQP